MKIDIQEKQSNILHQIPNRWCPVVRKKKTRFYGSFQHHIVISAISSLSAPTRQMQQKAKRLNLDSWCVLCPFQKTLTLSLSLSLSPGITLYEVTAGACLFGWLITFLIWINLRHLPGLDCERTGASFFLWLMIALIDALFFINKTTRGFAFEGV